MLSTPKKSAHKAIMEGAYYSPHSKRDSNYQPSSKEQYFNSSNVKKHPFTSNFDNGNCPKNTNNQYQVKMQEGQKIRSAFKNNSGYSFVQSPSVQKNLTSEKIVQQRLFTIQTNKYNASKEFEHTTPKKKNHYKRSLFSSDSLDSSNERENSKILNQKNEVNKENKQGQKKILQQNTHIFAATSIPSQKVNTYTHQQIHQSARKVNPFIAGDLFQTRNGETNIHIGRENRQMNAIAHERDMKQTPKPNKNILFPSSPTDQNRMSGRTKGDRSDNNNNNNNNNNYNNNNNNYIMQSPIATSSKTNKRGSKLQSKLSNSSCISNDSNNDINNNSCSSFNINNQSTGSSEQVQIYNHSYINSTPTKKQNANRTTQPSLLFREDSDRFETDYEILQVLGSGYFGTVYKCLNKLDKNIYAVKVTKEYIRGENSQKQILKEAQALAALSACDEVEYIVCYHSAWIEDRQLHLAMEFCDSNLDNFPLPHPTNSSFYSAIKKIFSDVVKGLHYLHSQNLVHLDLKPENILYNKKQNKFKIADLGLALIASKEHETYSSVQEGDARYLAKEVLNYYEAIDLKKSDIFSLGAMMYHLLTQKDLPANGDEWLTIRAGNLPKLDALTQCPKELKIMIKQMMNPDPELRLSTQEILDSPYMKSHLINEIKWQKIQKNLLIQQIQKLEKDQQKQPIKRRNSQFEQKKHFFN